MPRHPRSDRRPEEGAVQNLRQTIFKPFEFFDHTTTTMCSDATSRFADGTTIALRSIPNSPAARRIWRALIALPPR
jgi:hypothetical protein